MRAEDLDDGRPSACSKAATTSGGGCETTRATSPAMKPFSARQHGDPEIAKAAPRA